MFWFEVAMIVFLIVLGVIAVLIAIASWHELRYPEMKRGEITGLRFHDHEEGDRRARIERLR